MNALFVAMADYICKELTDRDVIVHRVESESSNSIYLKLDWGAGHTIRIGDHLEKRHLNFRYNIGTHITHWRFTRNPTQYYFPVSSLGKLIEQVLSDRQFQIEVRGKSGYCELVKKRLQSDEENESHFWNKAQMYIGGKS